MNFQQLVENARKQTLDLTVEQERQVIKIFETAGQDLVNRIATTRGAATQALLRSFSQNLYKNLDRTITENGTKSADIQAQLHASFLSDLAKNADVNLNFNALFGGIPGSVIQRFIQGDVYTDGMGLSDRIWGYSIKAGADVQTLLLAGLAQGKSAINIAKGLEAYVDPTRTIEWKRKKIVEHLGVSSGRWNPRIEYNSLRLARTTINHAATIGLDDSCKKNPFVEGVQWHTSNSHESRMHGRSDECDDRNGKIFKIGTVPLDHPNGLCYQTPYIPQSFDEIASELHDWAKGGKNPKLDDWYAKQYKSDAEDETAVGSTQSKPVFDPKKYGIKTRKDLEKGVKKFYGALNTDEQSAIRKYVGNGNSFDLNKYLYTGGYDQELASQLTKEQLKARVFEIDKKEKSLNKLIDNYRVEIKTASATRAMEIKQAVRSIREELRNLDTEMEKLKDIFKNGGLSQRASQIDAFSKVIQKGRLPSNMKVIRNVDTNAMDYIFSRAGVDMSDTVKKGLSILSRDASRMLKIDGQALAQELTSSLSGIQYINQSFISTSTNVSDNVFRNRPIQMELYVDKGTPALVTDNWWESEIVFDKNSKIEILDFEARPKIDDESNFSFIMKARIVK